MKKIIFIILLFLPTLSFSYLIEEKNSDKSELINVNCLYEVPFEIKKDGNNLLNFWISSLNANRINFNVKEDKMCLMSSNELISCNTLTLEDEKYYFRIENNKLDEWKTYNICSDYIVSNNIWLLTDKEEYNLGDNITVSLNDKIKLLSWENLRNKMVKFNNSVYLIDAEWNLKITTKASILWDSILNWYYIFEVNWKEYQTKFLSNKFKVVSSWLNKVEDLDLIIEVTKDNNDLIISSKSDINFLKISTWNPEKYFLKEIETGFPVKLTPQFILNQLNYTKSNNLPIIITPILKKYNNIKIGKEEKTSISYNFIEQNIQKNYIWWSTKSIWDIAIENIKKSRFKNKEKLILEVKNNEAYFKEDIKLDNNFKKIIDSYAEKNNFKDLDEKKLKELEKEITGNKNSWPFIIFIILFIFIFVMFIYFKRKNLK